MTSRGRKVLSVTCGDSSPKGRAKASYIGTKEMERICIDTLHSLFYGYPSMRVPPESRMVVKRFPSRHPLPLPVGEVAERSEDGEGKKRQRPIGKCWHLRRQMTSRGRKVLSVTSGDSSPKGRAKASYIGTKKWSVSVSIRFHSLFYGYPSMRVPPESRMVVKRFPSRHPLPPLWERWPSAARTERANNGNVQSENAGTFAGR